MDDNDLIYDDGGFEDGDQEQERNPENAYYNAKGLLEDGDDDAALEELEDAINLEEGKPSEWGFKAYKKMAKIFAKKVKLAQLESVFKKYLPYTAVVSPNTADKGMLGLFDFLLNSKNENIKQFAMKAFGIALEKLKELKNIRLWFRVSQRLCKQLMALKNFELLQQTLAEMHQSCRDENGDDDAKKSAQLVEIYAMKIQIALANNTLSDLKVLSQQGRILGQTSIPNANVLAVLKEGSACLAVLQADWALAYEEAFDAFKSYDEAGVAEKRLLCLRNLVLASILKASVINPFDSPETKPYRNSPEVVGLDEIYRAYERRDIHHFSQCIKKLEIEKDPIFKRYIPDLLRAIHQAALVLILKPYSRTTIKFVASKLKEEEEYCVDLVSSMISEGKLLVSFDQTKGIIENKSETQAQRRYVSLSRWAAESQKLENIVSQKMI